MSYDLKLLTKKEQIEIIKGICERISDKEITVRDSGHKALAYTDGQIIGLPLKTTDFKSLRGLSAHEGSHNRFGTFSPTIKKLEIDLVNTFKINTYLAHQILNIVEDVRVNHLLSLIFEGFYIDLLNFNKSNLNESIKSLKIIDNISKKLFEILIFLNDSTHLYEGKYKFELSKKDQSKIKKLRQKIIKNPSKEITVKVSFKICKMFEEETNTPTQIISSARPRGTPKEEKKESEKLGDLSKKLKELEKKKEKKKKLTKSLKSLKKELESTKKSEDLTEESKKSEEPKKEGIEEKEDLTDSKEELEESVESKKMEEPKEKEDLTDSKEESEIMEDFGEDSKKDFEKDFEEGLDKFLDEDFDEDDFGEDSKKDSKGIMDKLIEADKKSLIEGLSEKEKEILKSYIKDNIKEFEENIDKIESEIEYLDEKIDEISEEGKKEIEKLIEEIRKGETEKKCGISKKIDRQCLEYKDVLNPNITKKFGMYPIGGKYTYENILKRNSVLIRKLKSRFSALKVKQKWKRGYHSGKLDKRSLIRTIASDYTDTKCFSKKIMSKLPRIALLIDLSGSMGKGYGSKMAKAKEAAVILVQSLNDITNLKIVGFCGDYRAMNLTFKEFDEPINKEKLDQITAPHIFVQNLDGTSLENEAQSLTRKDVIIIISDGQPHGDRYYDIEEAEISFKKVKQRTNVFGFSIESYGDYLTRLYGKNYILCDRENLEEKLLKFVDLILFSYAR